MFERFAVIYVLFHTQAPMDCFEPPLAVWAAQVARLSAPAAAVGSRVVQRVRAVHAPDAIHDFFISFQDILNAEDDRGDAVHVDGSSTMGLFLRQLVLAGHELMFEGLALLYDRVVAYIAEYDRAIIGAITASSILPHDAAHAAGINSGGELGEIDAPVLFARSPRALQAYVQQQTTVVETQIGRVPLEQQLAGQSASGIPLASLSSLVITYFIVGFNHFFAY
jgi:hypothetical protein